MAKTFDEWYDTVEKEVYSNLYSTTSIDIYSDIELDRYEIKMQLQKAWEASRQNMTTKDI